VNCPYGVIQMAAVRPKRSAFFDLLFGRGRGRGASGEADAKVAVKCDLCRDLEGRHGEPRAACVASCPTGAIIRVNPKRYVDELMAVPEE
jgi:Fe-S-cluster-containing hydrogenase component 2